MFARFVAFVRNPLCLTFGLSPAWLGSVVVERVIEKGLENPNIGFDAYHGTFVDMFAAGIIDPTKVISQPPHVLFELVHSA